MARYVKAVNPENPAWFYLHVVCQFSAYVIGIAGFSTGIQLRNQSAGIVYSTHRTIGIILFCFCTLQVSALLFKPKKDQKYRVYWTWCHRLMGLTVIILGVTNVFKGLDILKPERKWRQSYLFVIIAIGVLFFVLEVLHQIRAYSRKKSANPMV